jgi:hypothetical protein
MTQFRSPEVIVYVANDDNNVSIEEQTEVCEDV